MKLDPPCGPLREIHGPVGEEGLTLTECQELEHRFWVAASTTLDERLSKLFERMRDVFAALGNDTDAMILHIKKEPSE